MAKSVTGICAICGLRTKLTFEHCPPKASGNRNPVRIKEYRHLFPIEENSFGRHIQSNRGFGGYNLCISCNSFTGGSYVEAYINLADRGLDELGKIVNYNSSTYLNFRHEIKPLNFLKQVLIFHLCADRKLGGLQSILDSKELILNLECDYLPRSVNIYMYATNSPMHKSIHLSPSYIPGGSGDYSEFSFIPFGFLLVVGGYINPHGMKNITNFFSYGYNNIEMINFKLPVLKIDAPLVGVYG